MQKNNHNPDVLSCLANLSSDEVFTPPALANAMLDLLPPSLWRDKNARFLDPACKSGVFLREIARRLIKGLEKQIPDLQARLNHIYTKQLYEVAITELTGLLARRSVYCSKPGDAAFICARRSQISQSGVAGRLRSLCHRKKKLPFVHCRQSQNVRTAVILRRKMKAWVAFCIIFL